MALSFATMNRMETSIQCLSLNQRLFESEYESQLIEILKKEYVCDRPHTLICLGIHDEMCGFPEVILRNNNRLRHSKCLADVKDWIQDLILKNNNIVNMRDCLGLAPLHLICSLHSPGQMEILKIFLTQELCHANALDGLSRTPLHHALSPANLKYHSKSDDQGESLVNIVSLLIKYGANANATECHGITPLHLALDYYKSGSANELQKLPELIKTLLEGGASLNLRAPSGYESLAPIPKSLTPLHLACRLSGRPSLDVLSLLVSPDYINTTDHLMKTPLHELLSVKKIKKMPQELTFLAPCNFILEKVELLIENGADVNAKDSEGMTPLLVALENPNHDYCGQLVKILLEKGADPNVRIAQSRVSPLHLACKYLNDELIELVPLFLNAGARLNTLDYNHLTPFHYALLRRPTSHFSSHHYLNVATLRSLVRYQADPTLNDVQGNSSIHMVCVSPNRHLRDVVAFLIREGCKINQINKQGNTPLLYFLQNKFNRQSIQTLIDLGADCRVINNEGISALHLVSRSLVYQDDVDEIVEVILKGGADVNTRDLDGNTPLHYAVRDESTTNIKAIRKLLLAGANLNIKNSEGMTPLHIVSSNGSHYLAKMFLNFGADVNVKDNLGNTPLHIAQAATENGSAMSRVLLENGANLSAENSRGATPFVIMSLNTHRFMIGYTVLMIEKRKYILNDKETKLLEHNRIFRKRYHNCYSCVLAMKDCFIGNSFVTLLEFLLAKNECAMRYARNPKIVNDLTHFADSARYRWYSDMIREKLSEVLFLKTLIDRSSRSLRIICYPFRLPDLVIDQVLSFLDDDDMNSLNRAVFQNP